MSRRVDREGVPWPRELPGGVLLPFVEERPPADVLAWAAWYSGKEPARARKGWMHALVVSHLREPMALPVEVSPCR